MKKTLQKHLFTNWDDNFLLNQIWVYCSCGHIIVGGCCITQCLNETIRRGIGNNLYHTNKTAQEILNGERY